ncbi:hypothetical protein VTN77DRAFT_8771 [Rasamsonia byssochlamydoides]|uniref:uncharacterized protein n=1 Tax=Rasamsonia byssochlamydoides TaxID=89139 RepID=UPI0037447DC6
MLPRHKATSPATSSCNPRFFCFFFFLPHAPGAHVIKIIWSRLTETNTLFALFAKLGHSCWFSKAWLKAMESWILRILRIADPWPRISDMERGVNNVQDTPPLRQSNPELEQKDRILQRRNADLVQTNRELEQKNSRLSDQIRQLKRRNKELQQQNFALHARLDKQLEVIQETSKKLGEAEEKLQRLPKLEREVMERLNRKAEVVMQRINELEAMVKQ